MSPPLMHAFRYATDATKSITFATELRCFTSHYSTEPYCGRNSCISYRNSYNRLKANGERGAEADVVHFFGGGGLDGGEPG